MQAAFYTDGIVLTIDLMKKGLRPTLRTVHKTHES